jgi:quercetin dioxygenase-like cupin family protein
MSVQGFFLLRPTEGRVVHGKFAGTVRQIICDADTPTDNLVAGVVRVLQPGGKIPLHHHHIEEFQFVLSGNCIAQDARGNKYDVTAGVSIYCRPGQDGAHGFKNTGEDPLEILFVFPNWGRVFPQIIVVEEPADNQ